MCKCWIVWLKLKMCESWQRQRRVIRQTEEEFGKASSFRVSQTDTFTTNTRCFWFLVLKACLWAEAITSVLSTCRVPLPALMAVTERAQEGGSQTLDYVLDPVHTFVCQACLTVHFPVFLSSTLLSQASQKVPLCRRALPSHMATILCFIAKWKAVTSLTLLLTSILTLGCEC